MLKISVFVYIKYISSLRRNGEIEIVTTLNIFFHEKRLRLETKSIFWFKHLHYIFEFKDTTFFDSIQSDYLKISISIYNFLRICVYN